jgi:hypothetical protein
MLKKPIEDATVRRLLMGPLGADSRRRDLSTIAESLNRSGPATAQGAKIDWIADVLGLGHLQTWRGVLDGEKEPKENPFGPKWIRHEAGKAYRSFDLEDLPPEAEVPLRALAQATGNDLVAARLFHVLWVRYHTNPDDSAKAIDAYVRVASTLDGQGAWLDVVSLLGHAAMLVGARKDIGRLGTLLSTFDACGQRLLDGPRPDAFCKLAEVFLATTIESKWALPSISDAQKDRWTGVLAMLAAHVDAVGDRNFANDTIAVLDGWLGRVAPARRPWARRWRVEQKLAAALREGATLKATLLEKALIMATDYGLSDLVDTCRGHLRPAIVESSRHMSAITTELKVPLEYIKAIDQLVEGEPSWSAAIRMLTLIPFITTAPVATFEQTAKERVESSPLWAMIKSSRYRDGKLVFEANDPDAKKKEGMAQAAEIHLTIVLKLLGHFLGSTRERWTESGLFEAVGNWPFMDPKRTPFLARASERFAHEDWLSSGVIVATQYEGMIRDLARAAGYHATKGDGGSATLMDEALNSLIRDPRLRAMLGEEHAWWVEFLLCDPELGPNYRNEIAHANLDAGALSPTSVFLLWLLMVRLTFFGPGTGTP